MDTVTRITPLDEGLVVAEMLPATQPEQEVVYSLPQLSKEENDFALAMVEAEGNMLIAARLTWGENCERPIATAREWAARPAVALKIKSIMDAVSEGLLISAAAHLDQLARIRDLAVARGEIKVAYHAEKSRGEAAGIYQRHEPKDKGKGNVLINITMASKHDENI